MAKDASNYIEYFLQLPVVKKHELALLRLWDHLKVGVDGESVWVKDFAIQEIESFEVKSIPGKTLYYSKNGKLFLLNSLLPERNIPALLWSPIERIIQISLPSFNYNYFGTKEKIISQLTESEKEQNSTALLVNRKLLESYIETAPEIRLQHLKWVLIKPEIALITGTPMLPLKGTAFWQRDNHLIPAGYDLEFFILSDLISKKMNADNDCFILWYHDGSCITIEKKSFETLSISSVRLTSRLYPFPSETQ